MSPVNQHMYGDLILTPEQEKVLLTGGDSSLQGILHGVKLWPNGVVPYKLSRGLSKLPIAY